MTLSKSPVFGNYIHSEPKFIGAFPDRKDYPFNTGNYDIQVERQHKQPETKPGVYITECLNASFAKEPNVLPLPQGVRISTIAATHPINIGTPDTFKMNQPIFMDKQAERRLEINVNGCSHSIKFLTLEDVDKELAAKSKYPMGEANVNIFPIPQTTYSATIVLASGRVVDIPNPNEKDWTLKSTEKVTRVEPLLLDHEEGNEDVDEFVLNSFVEHEEGRCWLKDMSRIIEQKDVVSPFETKFSYVTEIRKYVRKPIETPIYECTMPALRCLW